MVSQKNCLFIWDQKKGLWTFRRFGIPSNFKESFDLMEYSKKGICTNIYWVSLKLFVSIVWKFDNLRMSLNSKSVGTCLDCTTLNPHRVTLLNCVIYGDKRMTSRAKSDLKCFKVCKTKELLCLHQPQFLHGSRNSARQAPQDMFLRKLLVINSWF